MPARGLCQIASKSDKNWDGQSADTHSLTNTHRDMT